MATVIKTPGVYIQEISKLPASVAPVATAIPAFIGYTERRVKDGKTLAPNVPVRITSFPEYEEIFGGGESEALDVTIQDKLSGPGGTLISRVINVSQSAPSTHNMYYALQMYFANGGGPCWIVSINPEPFAFPVAAFSKDDFEDGLAAIKKVDEATLLLMPETSEGLDADDHYEMAQQMLSQCALLQDRFTIIDAHANDAATVDASNTLGTDNLKYGAVYHPYLNSSIIVEYADADVTITHTTEDGNTNPPGAFDGLALDDLDSAGANTNLAIYNVIKSEISKQAKVQLSPGTSIAGIYARVDRERGVWKAPANVSIRNVVQPSVVVSAEEQENLNVNAVSGKSINAIRTFAGKGILVWGSRTLAGNDNEWRYVPVRRLFIFVEESVKKATEFSVFEPNDANTWKRVKGMIENFLVKLWREGALAGAKPEQAFYVNVGLGETMTPVDILEGRMNVEIGMAAVRPAEFIILKFSHKLQES
ncbi:MAG: phage tail sheath family protein [Flavobacteriales bacterium]|nr:phage tail sheath family protein [Flavobacteriales bacterium]MCB9448593.1 phage tail sheath family protein [Flavobacteriales bacterium]